MSTADRVRSLIAESGLTQHAFALSIGLDDAKLSKSLSGTRRLSSLDLARIAEQGGVSVDWLITGVEPALAMAARRAGGSAARAIREAKRLSTLRSDLAFLGYRQPWRRWTPIPARGSRSSRVPGWPRRHSNRYGGKAVRRRSRTLPASSRRCCAPTSRSPTSGRALTGWRCRPLTSS